MKKILLVGCMMLLTMQVSQAQILKEWLRQKKTQKEYLLTQIAANQIYLELLKKGYRVVKTGMGIISDIKHGEFSLHHDFFQSLTKLNPLVKRYGKVPETIALQLSLIQKYQQLSKKINTQDLLKADEQQYAKTLANQIFASSYQCIESLLDLLLAGNISLRDKERLERLQQFHQEIVDHQQAMHELAREIDYLLENRAKEIGNINKMERLQQINQ